MKGTQSGLSESSAASQVSTRPKRYHSAELVVDGLANAYQFKIWCMDAAPMCFLVREDSEILQRIREGDILPVKYYSHESPYPSDFISTEIRNITRTDQGPFRGHYMVGIRILEGDR